MDHRPTTVERAYQLAKSGEYAGVSQIKDRLKVEGYSDVGGQLYGPTIRGALRRLCTEARKDLAPVAPTAEADDADF